MSVVKTNRNRVSCPLWPLEKEYKKMIEDENKLPC